MSTPTLSLAVSFIFHNRVRRTRKKKSWRLSGYSMTTAPAKSLSKISSGWRKSSGRTSRTRSYRCVWFQMWGNTQKEDVPVCKTSQTNLSLLRNWLVSQWVVDDIRSDKIPHHGATADTVRKHCTITTCFWLLFRNIIVSRVFFFWNRKWSTRPTETVTERLMSRSFYG